ncbi:peptidoglycan-binding domain-containing protein [Streptomyces sp. NPDC047024]|uniref:peptidoglycan-binding domain-containing protein n=1 Tax=Streptomyces sp. NPDC047024 TaxID=3155476 RepID=UPI0033EE2D17
MRPNAVTRALVTAAALAGLAAGGLAEAGSALAAPAAPAATTVNSQQAAARAVNNLGLTAAEAKDVQRWLKRGGWGYQGAIDGQLGPASWKALQRFLRYNKYYGGPVDGIVGTGTVKGIQHALKALHFYSGGIDGIAGPKTRAGFKKLAHAARGW